MLYTGYLIILDGQNKGKKSVSEISIFELPRLENCMSRLCPSTLGSSLCAPQMPLNHLQTAILKLLGGPWLGLDGPSDHYVGSHGCSSTRIVTK